VLAVYRDTEGKQLGAFDTGTGIMAPPVTYQVDGVQYVSILAGWGGSRGLSNDPVRGPMKPGYGRILTFVLGSNAVLKASAFGHKNPPPAPAIPVDASPQVVHQGELLYNAHCAGCHGVRAVAGPLPDLRYASKDILEGLDKIVLGGSRASAGMPSFQKILSADQVSLIRAYIVSRARASAKSADQSPR
jgi:quinohemoprotein ethanol dehydrogenase